MKVTASDMRRKLGARIKELRKAAGITQEELGEKASLNYKFIGELERGQVNVSLDSLSRIVEALRVNIADLFSGEKIKVQRVLIKEKNAVTKLSERDRELIKKALRLLNKTFARS